MNGFRNVSYTVHRTARRVRSTLRCALLRVRMQKTVCMPFTPTRPGNPLFFNKTLWNMWRFTVRMVHLEFRSFKETEIK